MLGHVLFAPAITDRLSGEDYEAQYRVVREALVWSHLGAGLGGLVTMVIAVAARVRWFFVPLAAVSSLLTVGPFVLGRTSSEFGAAPTVPIPEVALGVLYWFAPFVFALGPVLAARLAVRRPWGTPPTKARPRGFATALLAVLAAGGVLVGLGAGLYLAMLGGGGGRLFGFFVANAFNGANAMVHLTLVIVLPIAASALAVRAGWATRLLVMAPWPRPGSASTRCWCSPRTRGSGRRQRRRSPSSDGWTPTPWGPSVGTTSW